MSETAIFGTTALVALSGGGASAAVPHPMFAVQIHLARQVYVLPHNNSTVLYDQSAGSNGVGVLSQNFEPTFSIYDSNGADDFPSLGSAKIKEVVANGMYRDGSGPANSFDVILYSQIKTKKNGTVNAKVRATCSQQRYTDLTGAGFPDIELSGCQGRLGGFDAGGWVAVIANMSFEIGGEWAWNTNDTINGSPSLWRNPGGGFSDCTQYHTTTDCDTTFFGEGGDFAFALLGR